MRAVSLAGAPVTVAVLTMVVAIVLAVARKRTLLMGWLAAVVGGGILDWGLKTMFRRPRPEGAGPFLNGHSWSFPSGHSMGSLIAYGMLAYLLLLFARTGRQRVAIVVAAAVLVLAIGFSRLYLGVHFTDVIGGFAAAALWLSTCISGVEIARRRRLVEAGEPESHIDTSRTARGDAR